MKNKIFTFCVFLTIFISSYRFFNTPFEGHFHYIIFLFLLPIFFNKYGAPVAPFKILFLPILTGVIHLILENNTIDLFAKIALGVFLSTSFYYYVMLAYEFDVEKLFQIYLKWAYYTVLIGYVQLISYYIHFQPGYDYSWLFNKWGVTIDPSRQIRVNSIFPEPSQFAIVIAPAVFLSIHNLLMKKALYYKKHECLLIIGAVILSSSSLGVLSLFICLALLTINYGKFINLLVAIILSIVIGRVFYTYMPNFQVRVDSAMGLWVDNRLTIENVNTSSFVLYNNWHIALENFKHHPLFGTGLGSHTTAFGRYSLTLREEIIDFDNNKSDANSMLLRLISETGLMGVIFIFSIIFKSFVKRNPSESNDQYWLISNSILVLIILYLLRQGNYFINGLPFFLWMYYYTKKVHANRLLEESSTINTSEPNDSNQSALKNDEIHPYTK